ncbi:BolA family protein [Psychromonas sp. CNPT3]|uniref:BolA family protein n=1 Tax=Psychromonas sp. CNPT3 TaxID=314282 RepID=UPI00006E5663|nr:BolA/IbaG family iron-sulfur metabolism protein [Psychromonas sp. CNPT3]AGH81784.1 BolA family protein [Psychromonas sp. CNPT3]
MKVQAIIEAKINTQIDVEYLNVENESMRHAVPPNSETHFKVIVSSSQFIGMPLLARHRLINAILAEQLAGPIHALALHTYTPEQWSQKNNIAPISSDCLGGGK